MKCAPWTTCDFVSCQGKASSRTGLETRLRAVEVEHYGARPQYCETDKTIGFRFKSGFARYREWHSGQENDVR